MKNIIKLVFILMLTTNLYSQQDVVTRMLELNKGGTVKLEANPGNIDIKTWSKDEVLVKVSGLSDDEADELEIKSRGDVITIKYVGRWGWNNSADYSITVPEKVNLELQTTGGEISIHNYIDGNVDVNTMGGKVRVQDISGNARLETMGGDIIFKNIFGKGSIITQGGNIRGENISGSAREVKTMGGDIKLNKLNNVQKVTTFGGDIEINESIGDIELTTFGGQIELNKAHNGVAAKSYGGEIFIGQANGFVDVNTAAGNIKLQQIFGSVKARTSAGDIYVTLTPSGNGESELRTDAGDIILSLPYNSKVDVEAKAIASGWGQKSRKIIVSDFEGDIRDRRGDVIGDFVINGGGNKIYLKTTSGKIQIKKKN